MSPQIEKIMNERPQPPDTSMLREQISQKTKEREQLGEEYLGQREKIRSGPELSRAAELQQQGAEEVRNLSQELRDKLREPTVTFQPSKTSMDDLIQLFAMTSTAAFMSGGEGRYAGLAAMGNLVGALDGYQKGRQDLFKQELQSYDRNLKAQQSEQKRLADQLQAAQALRTSNREEAAGLLKQVETQLGESRAAYEVRVGNIDKAIGILNDTVKAGDRIAEKLDGFLMNLTRDSLRQQEQNNRFFAGLEQRHQEFLTKLGVQQDGKPLSEKNTQAIEGLDSLSRGLEELKNSFKPEYAGLGVFGFGADLELEAKRRLGTKESQGAIAWWAKYQQLQAPNRHALFGATLTGNELKNYQSYTAKPSDGSETVKTFLQNQIDFTKGTAQDRINAFETGGYKVKRVAPRNFSSTYNAPEAAPVQPSAPVQPQATPSAKPVIKLD